MKFVKYGFNSTSFTATNKASNMAVSVPLFINFHKLRCPVAYNYWNLFNFSVCKDVKNFGKQSRNYTVYSKTVIKANCVDKGYGFLLIYLYRTVKYKYFIRDTSHSNIRHCADL